MTAKVLFEIPDPPYSLICAAVICGLICGKAFEVSIRQKTKEWFQGQSTQPLSKVYEVRLFIPYLGICFWSWVFVGSTLTVFAVTWVIGFALSTFVVLTSGLLVWFQLIKLLKALEKGGSKALESNSLF